MELGIYTFVDHTPDPITGEKISAQKRMQNLLEEARLADEVGLSVFGVGEHHRPDYIASAPAVILSAIAAQTKQIRLTSAVTVLSSDDPVRVYQEFAELDLISGGRAEVMAGRGSFIESYPLFGYDLSHYDTLFSEKLDLLLKIREQEKITWKGTHRAPIRDRGVYPRAVQNPLPVWIAVGGTPESVIRAATLSLPLSIAIIGGRPDMFVHLVMLYRETLKKHGHPQLPIAIASHGYIAETQKELDDYFPYYAYMMNIIGKERGWSPITKETFDALCSPEAAVAVGTPEQIADKIIYQHKLFKHQRFALQITTSTMPHKKVLKAIELFGTKVAPLVKKALGV